MLKKIVKYGNSSALVLDKALLELLNMEEGSVVKIKTDGVSLIITPHSALVQETISPTPTIESAFKGATTNCLAQSFGGDSEKAAAYQEEINEICKRYKKRVKDEPEQQASAQEQMNREMGALNKKYPASDSQNWDSINMDALTKEFEGIHRKYQHVMAAASTFMGTPEYIHEMALLAEKFQNSPDAIHSKEYLEASTQLISKSVPEYAAYQAELKKIGERADQQVGKKDASKSKRSKKQ